MEMEAGVENVTMPDGHETGENLIPSGDLSEFTFKSVLSHSQDKKLIFLQGTFGTKPGPVVLLLEKEPFNEDELKSLFSSENKQEKIFQNDIYSYFRTLPVSVCNGIKVTSIYPATEKHIRKYSHQPIYIVNETAELYKTVTLPCIEAEQFSLLWVYNILEHKSETDRIVLEDSDPETGFILLPDLKWDGKNVETLHLLALPMKRGILSIRDLTVKHLPLLNNIYNKSVKIIAEKYSIPESRLRIFFHYQPSFYHLHVHFTFIEAQSQDLSKNHSLTTVINNINLVPNYYQLATLPFEVKESDFLFESYELSNVVKR